MLFCERKKLGSKNKTPSAHRRAVCFKPNRKVFHDICVMQSTENVSNFCGLASYAKLFILLFTWILIVEPIFFSSGVLHICADYNSQNSWPKPFTNNKLWKFVVSKHVELTKLWKTVITLSLIYCHIFQIEVFHMPWSENLHSQINS